MQMMNRRLLKENAQVALKRNFWMILLVVFVGFILGSDWNGMLRGTGYVNINMNNKPVKTILKQCQRGINAAAKGRVDGEMDYEYDESVSELDNVKAFYKEFLDFLDITHEQFLEAISGVIAIILAVLFVLDVAIICIQFAVGSFLSAPVGVGMRKFFMNNRKGEGKFSDLFSVFSGGRYLKTVKTMFVANIQMYAWSLLFVVPGWIKRYQLYFVAYIMAENANIAPARAREISKQITKGYKWQIFVLQLSFIGWTIVAILLMLVAILCSCGVLAVPSIAFLFPLIAYQHATYAELYAERREYALVNGIVTKEELCGF